MSESLFEKFDPNEPEPPRDRSDDSVRRYHTDRGGNDTRRARGHDGDRFFGGDLPRRHTKTPTWVIVLCCVAVLALCVIAIGLLMPNEN